MNEANFQRDLTARIAKSIFDRGLPYGSTGNISVRLSDGSLRATPTGTSMEFLDPGKIRHLSPRGELLAGDQPTKEMPLHSAFYETRPGTGDVVHLHCCRSTARSTLSDVEPDDALPPLTAYGIMLVGKVKLLPFLPPGNAAIGTAIRGLAGKRSAVLLADHGPVIADKDLRATVNATKELEATARLAILLRGQRHNKLTDNQMMSVVTRFIDAWA